MLKNERKTVAQTIYKPFTLLGNVGNCKVRKFNPNLGDGDIYTGDGGKVLTSVVANLRQVGPTIVRLTLTYNVWESSWEKGKKKADNLCFTGSFDFDLSEFYRQNKITKNGVETITENWNWQLSASATREAYYKDYFKTDNRRTGWLKFDSRSYPQENRPQAWLPTSTLRLKIDDSGSELDKAGSIGVTGFVRFSISINKLKTTFIPDEVVNSKELTACTYGNWPVLPSIPNKVSSVLGRGYKIDGNYARTDSLASGFVLDLDKLNKWKRVERNDNTSFDGLSVQESGSKEYTSKLEKSLNVKVAAGAFGVSFSSETKKTFSEERYQRDEYKFLTIKSGINYQSYRIQGYNYLPDLTGFLNAAFLNDLNTMTSDAIIEKYGTHVVLGMVMGGRMSYNMSYKQALSKISTSRTFSNTTSLSYNKKTGELEDDKKQKKMNPLEELFEKGKTDKDFDADKIKALAPIAEAISKKPASGTQSGGSSGGGYTGGTGFGFSSSYSESFSTDSEEEYESTDIKCSGAGGEVKYFKYIEQDPNNYTKWLDSLNPSTADWCDFVWDTLVPIYELVPAGKRNSANDIQAAWTRYLIKKSCKQVPLGSSVVSKAFNVMGTSKKTHNFAKDSGVGDYDREIHSSSGKTTAWRLKFELINIDGGNIAVAVWLTVFEGGFNAGRSIIQLRDQVYIPKGNHGKMAVDTESLSSSGSPGVCEFEGSINGKHHDWIDITDHLKARQCPFIDTTANRLYVKLDGSGYDYDNIGVKGVFKIPYIYYK